jgi:hypothetical protein
MKMFDGQHRKVFVKLLVVEYELVVVGRYHFDMLWYDVVVEDTDDDVNELVHVVLYIHLHYLNHRLMMNSFRVLD